MNPSDITAVRIEADRFVAEAMTFLRDARALVIADTRAAAATLTRNREGIFALLGDYQRFKHGRVFDPVIAEGHGRRGATARLLKCECVLMGDSFAAYVSRWQHADLAAEWPAYRRDMMTITEQLLDHLRVEQAAIASLLGADRNAGDMPATR
ncbi:hypothetical protein [Sphingomonas kyungheensis]|uniref:Hemerythrin-like domain-containing protein n=1 Tax=Sphingomonas kyungheensis TaxID=1069987 RepID=A0ABU8H066_9SPHN